MKKTILEKYNIKKLDIHRLIYAMHTISGSGKVKEIFERYNELEEWEKNNLDKMRPDLENNTLKTIDKEKYGKENSEAKEDLKGNARIQQGKASQWLKEGASGSE